MKLTEFFSNDGYRNRIIQALAYYKFGNVGSGNFSQFEEDGTLVANGDATVFDDIFIGFSGARVPAANQPSWTTFVGNLNQYTFDVNDYLELSATEIEHSYKEGSDIEIHIHWATNGTDVSDRTVKWEVEYSIANMITGAFSSSTVVSVEDTIPAGTADRTHFYTNISEITGTGFKIGANFIARVRRIASSGTEPSSDPFGLMLGLHVEKDTIGSRQESSK